MVPFSLQDHRLDYEALASEFLRACPPGGLAEPLKAIMQKYRDPPLTLVRTTRLIMFLHHLIRLAPTYTTQQQQHQQQQQQQYAVPLGQLFEDFTLALSLRSQSHVALSTWIVAIQFMLSCLHSNQLHALQHNAGGITTPIILKIIKHVLLELTLLPTTDMDSLQSQCFNVGKELLDQFLVREPNNNSDNSQGIVSFYDVISSFPKLYDHFLNSTPTTGIHPQPSIANHNMWLMTLHYMIASITQDNRSLDRIPTARAINIIKHVLREINTLPPNLTTAEVNCLNKGKELINLFLLGPAGDGVGVVSHYDIIVALPDVYGHFLRGTFAQSIHWTMEKFVNELGKRRRHLAFLMMPPDASWPLISQMSRRHEYNDLTTRTSYHMFEGDLIEFVKEGNSTNIETHFRDMLFQRASMDEFRQLVVSLTQTGLDTTQIRKAMVAKVRDVIRCIQQHSRGGKREVNDKEQEPFNQATASVRGEDIKMLIPDNIELWELMTETADQLYSFVAAEFFSYEDILQDFHDLVYKPDGELYPPGAKYHLSKDNGLVWLLLQLIYIEKVSTNVIQKDFENDERLFDKLVRLYNEDQIRSKDAFSLRDLSLQCTKSFIKDITNIKQRHPRVVASLQYAGICYQIQAYFSNHYHSNVPTNSTLFRNLDLQEMTKVAMESQLRQDVVPYTLYVYLVPTKADIGILGRPGATYTKGGTLCYKLLDLLSVNAKHRLLQVIYKMMLDSVLGPRYQANMTPPITCVPPHVLDVVYKLLYSAPCSAELMIKEIFDKLRVCDKMIKKQTDEHPNEAAPFPDQTMRWLHTRMQIDVKVLRSLDDPNREKPVWFAESEMLGRAMVSSICRLIKTRGQADLKTEQIHRVLSSLYEYRLEWSEETMQYFPEAVRSFYVDVDSPNQAIPCRPAVNPVRMNIINAT
ncbi:hypothetical protein DFQ30_008459 [Apophysomyces sp. BC1015]|nr:hypothetical protein DFQ30_008459 [Apophysomyces sp. BC1015]